MDFQSVRNILIHFADSPADLLIKQGKVLIQVREELIEATLVEKEGNVYVDENGAVLSAEKWIVNRIAKLPVLADRIISHVPLEKHFVRVDGKFLDDISVSPEETVVDVGSVEDSVLKTLNSRLAGVTKILYITSEAGEGKTTIIEHISRKQAESFKKNETDWLLLPVSLGGRPFIRFDDVVIGALTNKLRFPFLYYDSVIELAKLGVLVLALDGFEEMFIETSSGDAISALGTLVQNIGPSARLVVAARRAYFEFKSLKTQSQLFDAISKEDVSFSRISINRWGKNQFLDYGKKRNIDNIESIYDNFSSALKSDHPLLSRAVLVKRLVDVAEQADNINDLTSKIVSGGEDYFKEFVDFILEREANEKWLNKRGELASPLLSKDEHYSLLAFIAEEMWRSSTNTLPTSVIDMIGELACEAMNKDVVISRQVVERIKDHALVRPSTSGRGEVEFDHEEFKWFFLGMRIISYINDAKIEDIKVLLRVAPLPDLTINAVVLGIKRCKLMIEEIVKLFANASATEGPSSFVKQNCGAIILKLADGLSHKEITLDGMVFPYEALAGKNISKVIFKRCYFQPTSLLNVKLSDCQFIECKFDVLEIDKPISISKTTFMKSLPASIIDNETDNTLFEPFNIRQALEKLGVYVKDEKGRTEETPIIEEHEMLLVKRAIRAFYRSTQVNEDVIKIRLGSDCNYFMTNIIPQLTKHKILFEVPYRGGGHQRRFSMGIKMTAFEEACVHSKGSFDKFIDLCEQLL